MTLVSARQKAAAAISEGLSAWRPKVVVTEYDGAFSTAEIKRLYTSTPSVLVSALSSGKDGIKLAAYLLMKSTDKGLLELADLVTGALRHLPGVGQPVLNVSSRSLYDNESSKIGARLWGFAALWPHLMKGDLSGETGGPIRKEIQRIRGLIDGSFAGVPIGGTEAERTLIRAESEPPLFLITPGSGQFETDQAGPVKFTDSENTLWSRQVTGAFDLPMEIECWGRDEAEAESMGTALIPLLSFSDSEEGLNKKVKIIKASPANDDSGAAVFRIGLNLFAQIGGEPVQVPVFRSATTESDNE